MATPEYARSDGNANHLIELFDTGRSQWLAVAVRQMQTGICVGAQANGTDVHPQRPRH